MSGDRGIDADIAKLQGEAAQQHVGDGRRVPEQGGTPFDVWRSDPAAGDQGATYYDRPAIKEPVWIWAVPAYFYVGGAAGAAATLGAAAQSVGRGRLTGLVEKCRRLTMAGTMAGSALLVYDLGRPERFLNMLRVWRPTSPLNIGSWILAAEAGLSTGAVVLGRRAPALAGAAGMGAGVLGVPYSGYTAVLLADTAVPIWQSMNKTLPFLYVASAVSSATALLEVTDLTDEERRTVSRLGVLGQVAEIAATFAVQKQASKVERVGRPLKEGLSGSLWKASTYLTLSALVASLLPGRSRGKSWLAAALGTAGALALRFSVFHAGKRSARDPRASFEMQRARTNEAATRPD